MGNDIKIGLNKTTILVILGFLVISLIYYLGKLSMDLDLKPLIEGNMAFTLIQFFGLFCLIILLFLLFSNKPYLIFEEKGIFTALMRSNKGWIYWDMIEKIEIKNNLATSLFPFDNTIYLYIYLRQFSEEKPQKNNLFVKIKEQKKVVINLNRIILKISDINEILDFLKTKAKVEDLRPAKK